MALVRSSLLAALARRTLGRPLARVAHRRLPASHPFATSSVRGEDGKVETGDASPGPTMTRKPRPAGAEGRPRVTKNLADIQDLQGFLEYNDAKLARGNKLSSHEILGLIACVQSAEDMATLKGVMSEYWKGLMPIEVEHGSSIINKAYKLDTSLEAFEMLSNKTDFGLYASPKAYFRLINGLAREGHYQEALTCFEMVAKEHEATGGLFPRPPVLDAVVRSLSNLGAPPEQFEEVFEFAAQARYKFQDSSLSNVAMAFVDAGKLDSASDVLEKVTPATLNVGVHMVKALILAKKGAYREAVAAVVWVFDNGTEPTRFGHPAFQKMHDLMHASGDKEALDAWIAAIDSLNIEDGLTDPAFVEVQAEAEEGKEAPK